MVSLDLLYLSLFDLPSLALFLLETSKDIKHGC